MPEASAARTKSSLSNGFNRMCRQKGLCCACPGQHVLLLWRQVSSLAPVFSEFLQ